MLFSNLLEVYSYKNAKITKLKGYSNVPGYLVDIFLKMPDDKLFLNINSQQNGGTFTTGTEVYELRNSALFKKYDLKDHPSKIPLVYPELGVIKDGSEMWIHSSRGLYLYKNGNFHRTPHLSDNGQPLFITYLTGDTKGHIWFINNYKDIVCYTKRPASISDTFPYVLQQQQYIGGEALDNQLYGKIFVDSKGRLWACGREKGLCILYTNDKGMVTRISKPDKSVFSSGIINDVAEDSDHNIWLGTASGLDKVTFHDDTFTVSKDIYSSELCGKYIFFVKHQAGKLFVGTTGCMGIFNTVYIEPKTPPQVYISGIKVNETSALHLLGTVPTFKPQDNIISFVFTGISFKDERRIRYSYMLEGLDNNWSVPRPEYSITYSRIPPGTYTFKVRALSANGIWSDKPATFTFTVKQPFYTQWWFVALVTATIAVIVYSIYRYRINQILEIQYIRQTISKDLHDDIGATVSSINILANMAKSNLVSENKRNQFLETIQEESKHVSESLNDIVWSINPKNDSLEIMFARMQRYASELFEAKNIAYDFILPEGSLRVMNMDMTRRQHIYLIFKEAVNNLAKYSEATKAEVGFSIDNGRFSVIIADNGKGFDPVVTYTGNGIFNMKKRAEDIKARLQIESAPGKGTTIRLSLTY
jgi:two-component sensor histidine kinase